MPQPCWRQIREVGDGYEERTQLDPLPGCAGCHFPGGTLQMPFPLRGMGAASVLSMLGLRSPRTASPWNCSCCPPPLVLAALTPLCIPCSKQPGPATPGKAASSPLALPTPSVPLCVSRPAACRSPQAGGGACWRGAASSGCSANRRQQTHCPPAPLVLPWPPCVLQLWKSPAHPSVWSQAAWGLLPRDRGHTWCAPHGHPVSQCWHTQPHAPAHDGMLLQAGTCMMSGDAGPCRRAVWCCFVTSPLKHSCPPPVPRAVCLLLRRAQPGNDPAGMGTVPDFLC